VAGVNANSVLFMEETTNQIVNNIIATINLNLFSLV